MNIKLPQIILASASPRRAELLRQLKVPFQVLPAHTEEPEHEYLTPTETSQLNAFYKAREIGRKYPEMLVVGADTVVCMGVTIYGKPKNLAEARQTLAILQGKTHEVITGVCLVFMKAGYVKVFCDRTRVTFKKLSPAAINAYLSKIHPMDKAGAYAIQEHGDLIIKKIEGSYSNVVGLPLESLKLHLKKCVEFLD